MKIVTINTSETYEVRIGAGLLSGTGAAVQTLLPGAETAALVTDGRVDALYGATVMESLANAGFAAVKYVLEEGEASKNGENFLRLLNFFAENHLTRSDVVLALGGGVVGDLTGFAAACYLRGVACIQLPTTLLADVDSSVGGKTAIDLAAGKNLAGAFCQPALVLCDHSVLKTLPGDVFADGCAEVIKYGILGDTELFSHLTARGTNFDTEYVLERCVSIKRDYVCADVFDTGVRRRLNLGHTLGHAIEAASGFRISHGKAVSIGMAAAARAAAVHGICSATCAAQITALLEQFSLPVRTELGMDVLFGHMCADKKRLGSRVSLILPEEIGRCRIETMDLKEAGEFMKAGL